MSQNAETAVYYYISCDARAAGTVLLHADFGGILFKRIRIGFLSGCHVENVDLSLEMVPRWGSTA